MITTNNFNLTRVLHLINRYLRQNFTTVFIATAGIAGIILLISIFQMKDFGVLNEKYFLEFSTRVMFVCGLILAGNCFKELNSPSKAPFYAMLPASLLEKLTASWLAVSIIYLVYALASILLINVLLSLAGLLFLEIPFRMVNIFSKPLFLDYASFLVIQSVFLFGATYFRKNNFLKTISWSLLVGFVIFLFAVLFHRILLGNFNAFSMVREGPFNSGNIVFIQNLQQILKIVFWGFTWPYFMVVSYLCLKERQV